MDGVSSVVILYSFNFSIMSSCTQLFISWEDHLLRMMLCGTSERVMRRRVSERGIGEIVAASLIIVAVAVLVFLIFFIYMNSIRSLNAVYSQVGNVLSYYSSRFSILNITCESSSCRVLIGIPEIAISRLSGVLCTFTGMGVTRIVSCSISSTGPGYVTVLVPSDVFRDLGYLRIMLLFSNKIHYSLPVYVGYPYISVQSFPTITSNVTGYFTLSLEVYDNASGWSCVNASILLYNVSGICRVSDSSVNVSEICISPGNILYRSWILKFNCTTGSCVVNGTVMVYVDSYRRISYNTTILISG